MVKISKQRHHVEEIYFPAITICPDAYIEEVSFRQTGVKFLKFSKQHTTTYFSDSLFDLLAPPNNSMERFLEILMKHTQLKWFKDCVFGDWDYQYKLSFSTILTKHGFCFTFNMQLAESMLNLDKFVTVTKSTFNEFLPFFRVSPDYHYKADIVLNPTVGFADVLNESTPWKAYWGSEKINLDFRRKSCNVNSYHGMMDDLEMYDPSVTRYENLNAYQPLKGIPTIIHNPNDYPMNAGNSFCALDWAVTYVTMKANMFKIDDGLKLKPVNTRHCYLDGEKSLIFFKIYTKSNCEHECLSEVTLNECNCVPFYMIRKKRCNQDFERDPMTTSLDGYWLLM